jgi:hypothetical protein
VTEEPAWTMECVLALWAVESGKTPGQIGWWVISGDAPTDYVSSRDARNPRSALRVITERWLEAADYMERGERHPDVQYGLPEQWTELAPLLRLRAIMLGRIAEDDSEWSEGLP